MIAQRSFLLRVDYIHSLPHQRPGPWRCYSQCRRRHGNFHWRSRPIACRHVGIPPGKCLWRDRWGLFSPEHGWNVLLNTINTDDNIFQLSRLMAPSGCPTLPFSSLPAVSSTLILPSPVALSNLEMPSEFTWSPGLCSLSWCCTSSIFFWLYLLLHYWSFLQYWCIAQERFVHCTLRLPRSHIRCSRHWVVHIQGDNH